MPKGKKTCPQCNTVVGCRTSVCTGCQYDFSKNKITGKQKQEVDNLPEGENFVKKSQADMLEAMRRPAKVYAPAGSCPIKLKGITKREVKEWSESLKDHYFSKSKDLTDEGLKYFVLQFYPISSDEYKKVTERIDSSR